MIDLSSMKEGFGIALIFMLGAISFVAYKLHSNPKSKFDAAEFFVDPTTGKPSFSRLIGFSAMFPAAYVVVYMAFAGTLTWEIFGIFVGGFVCPDIARVIAEAAKAKYEAMKQ